MSVLSDALLTEVLYLDGNPEHVVPPSTLHFLTEASGALAENERLIKELRLEVTGLRRSWYEEKAKVRLLESPDHSKP